MHRLLVVALLATAACTSNERSGQTSSRSDSAQATASALSERSATVDSAAIRATLDGWYRAMQALDSAGVLAPLTPQFLLLEDTLPLSGAELFARLKQGGADTRWSRHEVDRRVQRPAHPHHGRRGLDDAQEPRNVAGA